MSSKKVSRTKKNQAGSFYTCWSHVLVYNLKLQFFAYLIFESIKSNTVSSYHTTSKNHISILNDDENKKEPVRNIAVASIASMSVHTVFSSVRFTIWWTILIEVL